MNNTKRWLLIVVIICNFLNAALDIFLVVRTLMFAELNQYTIFVLVTDFLSIAGLLISAGFLIYAIAQRGRFFNSRRTYYLVAVTINLFMSLFTLSSLLLIISLFISDIVWVKPIDDVYFTPDDDPQEPPKKNKESEIAALRKRLERGEISEAEFKDELLRLL